MAPGPLVAAAYASRSSSIKLGVVLLVVVAVVFVVRAFFSGGSDGDRRD